MTVFTRLGALFALAAVALPFAAATSSSCKSTEFYYSEKSCCLTHGGVPNAPSPPSGTTCPSSSEKWYWSNDKSCCLPSHPISTSPSCPMGYTWSNSKCTRSTTPATPASPSKASPPASPGSSSCKSSEFWWEPKQCCLPHGGTSTTPTPPSGSSCPSDGWYWHPGQSCCVPKTPSPPTPTCSSGWSWGNWFCGKNPQPSGHHKRAIQKSRSLCPSGLEACPVPGLRGVNSSTDYECLDTTSELESCGGCASLGKGQDCTAIEGVWNVGCNKGSCVVYSCAAGYKVGTNGQSCIAL